MKKKKLIVTTLKSSPRMNELKTTANTTKKQDLDTKK